jgi:L,D-peptidoglycan transpeptidase YkuD (ErfK/YbiS/YcfS/YnhG family)
MPEFSVLNVVLAAASVLFFQGLATKGDAAGFTDTRQAIVVTTLNWDESAAVLQRYERKDIHSPWRQVGNPVKAVVGRSGLGWGRGLQPEPTPAGPQKKEGDGKAPAGIFSLGTSFGYADVKEVNWIKLPYRRLTADFKCIDDAESSHYNRIVASSEVTADWKSHEDMLREDGQYRLGVVVGHNTNPVAAGSGSCIFLHIWIAPTEGTSGCTAVSAEDMEMLLRWIEPSSQPILIQLPEPEYGRLRPSWNLP